MSEDSEPTAKVLFRVPYDDGTADVETLWAFDLGSDQYKLDNLPYFAYGVSWNDIVYAPYDEDEGFPTFQKVAEKSGNRTIRISFDAPVEEGNESALLLDDLVSLGCEYEGLNKRYIVVNIPPPVDLFSVAQNLVDSNVEWEYADPTYEELFPEEVEFES